MEDTRRAASSLLAWDQKISSALQSIRSRPLLWRLSVLLAHSGDSWFWLPALGLIWLFSRDAWHGRAALMAVGVFALALLVMAIKFTVRRSRPPGDWGGIYRRTDPHSFPSGHAARAFFLLVLAWQLGPVWFALLLSGWAPLVSLSRIATGMHYISDVLAGALIGLVAARIYLIASPWLMHTFAFLF